MDSMDFFKKLKANEEGENLKKEGDIEENFESILLPNDREVQEEKKPFGIKSRVMVADVVEVGDYKISNSHKRLC